VFARYVSAYLKAHMAGIIAALVVVLTDLNAPGGLHTADWYGIAAAFAAAFGIVAAVPNTPAPVPAPAVADAPQDVVA
jgi:hypothetical protein